MSWAGVRSENLASVWLTAHLCDQLGRLRLEEVAASLGLAPRIVDGQREPYRVFRSRLRDRYGIIVDQDLLRKAAYHKTLQHISPDLVFEGLEADYEPLRNLHYGLGFRDFMTEIKDELRSDPDTVRDREKRACLAQEHTGQKNFLSLSRLREELTTFIERRTDPSIWVNPDSVKNRAARYCAALLPIA